MTTLKKAVCIIGGIGIIGATVALSQAPQIAEAQEKAQLRRQIVQKEQEILRKQALLNEKIEPEERYRQKAIEYVHGFRIIPGLGWLSPGIINFVLDNFGEPTESQMQIERLERSIRESTDTKNALREQYRALTMTPSERIQYNQRQIQRQMGR